MTGHDIILYIYFCDLYHSHGKDFAKRFLYSFNVFLFMPLGADFYGNSKTQTFLFFFAGGLRRILTPSTGVNET